MISVCMIAKDEEAVIGRCLEALKKYEVEIIVVDTGSKDATKEIARRYTEHVYDYTWTHDFAEARNYSISKASNEFILVIDCDEIVTKLDIRRLEEMAEKNKELAGRLTILNDYTKNGMKYCYTDQLTRFFAKEKFEYTGMIHEQVTAKDGKPYRTYDIPLTIHHLGYDGDLEARKKKTKRNISLLNDMLEQNGADPYVLYQLGKSYSMQEDYADAIPYYDEALTFDLDERLEYVQDMVESYGYALINAGQYEKALGLTGIYDAFAHSSDFVFMIALVLMNNADFAGALQQFEIATKMKNAKVDGINGFLAYYNMGVIKECLGDTATAQKYYKKCGNYEPAKQRLLKRL
ncbi:glycosyl transferase, family 2 [Lachnospiraceae bacterium KM106-2]|nr:glycosyl transferase, family 2 [Lachnospiraceae bacterium KM106-2]